MKNMKNQMKKFATACFAALAIIAAAGTTAFAATETTTCTNCKGSGKAVLTAAGTKYKCISCGATGIRDCLHCLGKGTKTTGTPDAAPAPAQPAAGQAMIVSPVMLPSAGMGTMNTHTTCPVCRGTGRKVCTSCSGNGFRETRKSGINLGYGSSYYWVKSGCAACSGAGQAMCTHCGGDGNL